MWMFGAVSDEELDSLKSKGFEVKEVSKDQVNQFLEPGKTFDEDEDADSEKMIVIYWDYDLITVVEDSMEHGKLLLPLTAYRNCDNISS